MYLAVWNPGGVGDTMHILVWSPWRGRETMHLSIFELKHREEYNSKYTFLVSFLAIHYFDH